MNYKVSAFYFVGTRPGGARCVRITGERCAESISNRLKLCALSVVGRKRGFRVLQNTPRTCRVLAFLWEGCLRSFRRTDPCIILVFKKKSKRA